MILLYDYNPFRPREVPKFLLGDYRAYLQTDGDNGYGAVCAQNDITQLSQSSDGVEDRAVTIDTEFLTLSIFTQ